MTVQMLESLVVVEVSPTCRARYATGRGNASKDDVLSAVVRRYSGVDVNGNDEADSLVLAALGARWLGCPIDDPMPKANLEAMKGVHWPDRSRIEVAS
jgi:crossover junction endodeoxyribonuclease RuvC